MTAVSPARAEGVSPEPVFLLLFGRNRFSACDARDERAKRLVGKIGLRLDQIAGGLCWGWLWQGRLGDLRSMWVNFHSNFLHFRRVTPFRRVEPSELCTSHCKAGAIAENAEILRSDTIS